MIIPVPVWYETHAPNNSMAATGRDAVFQTIPTPTVYDSVPWIVEVSTIGPYNMSAPTRDYYIAKSFVSYAKCIDRAAPSTDACANLGSWIASNNNTYLLPAVLMLWFIVFIF